MAASKSREMRRERQDVSLHGRAGAAPSWLPPRRCGEPGVGGSGTPTRQILRFKRALQGERTWVDRSDPVWLGVVSAFDSSEAQWFGSLSVATT